MNALPVTDGNGNALLAFDAATDEPEHADDRMPLALVALWHRELLLLGFNRERRLWELPGGLIEPGETPRAAAARELEEETGYVVADLVFTGYARFSLDFGRRLETAAVFRGTAPPEHADAFTPSAEIGALCWWDGVEELSGRIQPLDVAIGRLARDATPGR